MNKIITLTEMAAEWPQLTGREHAEHVLQEQGYTIVLDELGRPGVSLADARAWREAERRAEIAADAHQAGFEAHKRDTKAWVLGRTQAIQAAHRRVTSTAGASIRAQSAAREAARKAAADYERSVARPMFDGRAGAALEYISEDEAGSLVARTKAKARRLVGAGEVVQ